MVARSTIIPTVSNPFGESCKPSSLNSSIFYIDVVTVIVVRG